MLNILEPLSGMPRRRAMLPYQQEEPNSPAGGVVTPEGTPAQIMADYYRSVGYPEHVIAGVLGAGMSESNLNPLINEANPVVEGSRGGWGVNQWTGPRRVALENFIAERGFDVNDPNQMALAQAMFTHHENQTTERNAWGHVMATQDPAAAAKAFTDHWLRPGINHSAKSQKNALKFADRVGAEASDIQVDLKNEKEQIALGNYTTAMMFASPEEKEVFKQSLKYTPEGRPTIQGSPHQPYQVAATDAGAAYSPLFKPRGQSPQDYGATGDNDAGYSLPFQYQQEGTEVIPPTGETVTSTTTREGPAPSPAPAPAAQSIQADERTVPDPSWKNRLEALGVGLAQLSANQVINTGGVWDRNIQRFNADTAAYGAETSRQNTALARQQEQRLREQQNYEMEQAANNESARMLFAQDHYARTGNLAEAQAIAADPGAFKTAFDSRFNAGRGQSVTDYQRQVAQYQGGTEPAVAAREAAAKAAEETGYYSPAMVEQIRNDASGKTAMDVMENISKATAQQKNLSKVPNYDTAWSTVNGQLQRAIDSGDTAKAQYLTSQLEALELGGEDPQSIAEVYKNIREYGQKGGLLTQEEELKRGYNQRTADLMMIRGHPDLAEVAMSDPKTAVEMADERERLAVAADADAREAEARQAVADNFRELAKDPEIDDATREQYIQMAALADAGNVKEAAALYKQLVDKPSEQRMLEWFQNSPEYLEVAKDLRRAQSGTGDRKSNVDNVWYKRLEAGSERQAQLVQQEQALLTAKQLSNDPDFQSGPLVGMLTDVGAAFQDIFGVNPGLNANSTNSQVFRSLSSGIIFLQKEPGSGHISDWDGQKFQEGIFSLDKGEDANRAVIQAMLRTNQLKQAGHDALMQYYSEGGDMNDKAAREAYVKEYTDRLNIPSEAFYDLDRAGGSSTGEKIDNPLENARMLAEQGKLQDGDFVFINGKMIPWSSRILEE